MEGKGKIIVISGPSGAGEDSIINGLEKQIPIERVVTTTSRDMRAGESEKNPYYFISQEEFEKGIEDGIYFEHAKHYNDKYYGVTFDEIERVKSSEKIGIWKIDYKGVIQAKKLMPDLVTIFINAPLDILEKRIRQREGVSEEYIKERMEYTREWLEYTDIYDHTVINEQNKLDKAISEVVGIIEKTELLTNNAK